MKRAPKGSTTARLLLKLEPDLKASAEDAARAEGIPVSEWWRRAGRERLNRPHSIPTDDGRHRPAKSSN